MIKSAMYFFSVLMMVNIALIGFGLYDESVATLDQYNLVSQTPEEIYDMGNAATFNEIDIGDPNDVFTDDTSAPGIPETLKTYKWVLSLQEFFGGWAFGWSAIFILLNFPMYLTYTLTNVIMLIQILSILYIVTYFIGGLLGGVIR